jgi:Rrf2 family protein
MFSKRARYALHGVGFLAHKQSASPVPFSEILAYLREYSYQLSLSPDYIKKIFQDLSRGGIVKPIVGRKGGYILGKPPEKLRIVDVVAAVDGVPVEECCLLSVGQCPNQPQCGVNHIIQEAQDQFYGFLARETAESLANKMFVARRPGAKKAKPKKRRTARKK